MFKVFLISLRPGVVCYAHLYISHFPLYTLFTHTPPTPPPRPFLYVMCKGRFVFACPVTLTVRSLKTRKGEKSGGLLVLSPFSNSFSKTGHWSLRRRIVSFHVLNTNLSQRYSVYLHSFKVMMSVFLKYNITTCECIYRCSHLQNVSFARNNTRRRETVIFFQDNSFCCCLLKATFYDSVTIL